MHLLQDKEVEKVISDKETGILSLPMHLFLKLIPQLSARLMIDKKTYTDKLLVQLLKQCCLHHPHHTIIHILALANASDELTSQTSQNIKPRTEAALAMLYELKNNHPELKPIIDQMRDMTKTLVTFSKQALGSAGTETEYTNSQFPLNSLRNLNKVHCPTIPLPVSIDCKYDNKIITILNWEPTIEIMTGLSKPKKLIANCSDGKKYVQLLKGNDDLRQDAVMQQVFDVVNIFLQQDPEAKKRKLRIQTYKVVPFSPVAGMLEFCTNTSPIRPLLYKYHKKHRPYSLDPHNARQQIEEAKAKGDAVRLQVFKEVCSKLTPVFQLYFYNEYPSPGVWYERKTMYTNSMATNSMVGYILGIGDRHVNK